MSRMHAKALAGALALGMGIAGSAAPAQAGPIDDTYGTDGVSFTPFHQTVGDRFLGVTKGPGGGVYAVGYTQISSLSPDRAMALARVGVDGELVMGFGTGGIATVNVAGPTFAAPPIGTTPTGTGEVARGVVVQNDGRIVISGQAETQAGAADSRDTDVYVARFFPSGMLDASFGTGGITRINLAPSVSATTGAPTGDQAWGLAKQSDDKLIIDAGRGTDQTARPGRTDRDLTSIRLTKDGALDTTYNAAGTLPGTSSITAIAVNGNGDTVNVSENARQPVIQPDGKAVLSSYSGIPATVAGSNLGNRPFIARFNTDGTLDSGFGDPANGVGGGVGSGQPLGVHPSFSEVYDIGRQGDDFVLAGYGQRASEQPANGVDLVAYRFDQDGDLDPTFGTSGATTYNQSGGEDRARDLVVLPDNRIAISGSTVPGGAGNGLNGLVFILNASGTPDTSVSATGTIQYELGGPSDGLWGTTVVSNGTKLVAVGYCGAAAVAGVTNGDNAASVRLDLTGGGVAPAAVTAVPNPGSTTCPSGSTLTGPAGPQGPPGADGDDGDDGDDGAPGGAGPAGPAGAAGTNGTNGTNGATGPIGPGGPAGPGGPGGPAGPAGPAGARGPAGAVGNIRVTCRLVPPRRRTITCTVRRATTTRGAVRVRVARAGRTIASGQTMALGKSALVRLKGAVRAGQRYTLITTLPAGPRTRTKVVTRIVPR